MNLYFEIALVSFPVINIKRMPWIPTTPSAVCYSSTDTDDFSLL
ncbi:hypothetical protein UNSWDHB_353 [Dehalobacter sp. UNSWDHB]|nr:hypothetical protein UNSWDHB_353 [Dehalobacter sp. UNSWDHB]